MNPAPPQFSADSGKRDRILDAALKIFAGTGVHGTPVPPIAEEARVGVGTLYRYFDSKEALVNAVFRRTKTRLLDHLLQELDVTQPFEPLFNEVWARLQEFAETQPHAFQFLEMQDHVSYLDAQSRAQEIEMLQPLLALVEQARDAGHLAPGLRPEVGLALFWGAFVGIVKARRLGYLALNQADFTAARDACRAALSGEGGGKHAV